MKSGHYKFQTKRKQLIFSYLGTASFILYQESNCMENLNCLYPYRVKIMQSNMQSNSNITATQILSSEIMLSVIYVQSLWPCQEEFCAFSANHEMAAEALDSKLNDYSTP